VAVPAALLEDRRPGALLAAPVARLAGFAALCALGAAQWTRMVEGMSVGRGLLWALVACAAGVAVVLAGRLDGRGRVVATLGTAAAGLVVEFAASGLDVGLLRPARWAELADGLGRGTEALGGVRLPYDGADPWPGLTLQCLGALLCVVAALLAFWPRGSERGRGYPFLALVGLLVLVATPVVSLGGTRPLVLGGALAALTVCFLWLERLPLRPGFGVAVLLGVAIAGALPIATVTDREQAWFDYKSFAEGLGPQDPIRFDWNHGYGPITWPRNGSEVLRVSSRQPLYWKARNLSAFDGVAWRDAGPADAAGPSFEEDLPADWFNRPGWTDTLKVTVRRVRTTELVGAGTIIAVEGSTRRVRPTGAPGAWRADSELRRGDSYTVRVHAPRPNGVQVAQSETGERGRQADSLALRVPLRRRRGAPTAPGGTPARAALVRFPPFAQPGGPVAEYPTLGFGFVRDGAATLRRSRYARTWRLAQRLKARSRTPFEYIRRVNDHLRRGYSYSERPTQPAAGRAPLDAFLFDTRNGYCQHFSGAMALLLRMGGIPARVATGFSPGGFSKRHDAWIVRDTDAHSWVEAWFDRFGWVTYDPTPDASPARSQIASLEAAPQPDDNADDGGDDAAGGGGSAGGRGRGVRGDLLLDSARDAATEGGSGGDLTGGPWTWVVGGVGGALAALLVGFLLIRRSRRRAWADSPLDRAIAELEAALRRAGRPAAPGTTLRQLEQRLGGSADASAYLSALRAGRYAATAPTPTAHQRRAFRRELAAGLGWGGKLRALLALPPRPRR
jgi:transglutaminase-like putative cysteine protease